MKVVNEKYKDKYLKYKNKYYNIKTNNYKQKGGDMLFYISSLSIVGIILWFIFKNPKKDTSDLKKIEREINKIPFLARNNDNIRINTISPGGIEDPNKNTFDKKFKSNYINRNPIKRMCSPTDVANAAIYLSSDSSSYVTGTCLLVDGGWTSI